MATNWRICSGPDLGGMHRARMPHNTPHSTAPIVLTNASCRTAASGRVGVVTAAAGQKLARHSAA